MQANTGDANARRERFVCSGRSSTTSVTSVKSSSVSNGSGVSYSPDVTETSPPFVGQECGTSSVENVSSTTLLLLRTVQDRLDDIGPVRTVEDPRTISPPPNAFYTVSVLIELTCIQELKKHAQLFLLNCFILFRRCLVTTCFILNNLKFIVVTSTSKR